MRCHQTVQPLADDRLLRIERIPALGVDATPAEVLALFWDRRLRNAVLCTHGETIGRLLSRLAADGLVAAGDPEPPARRAIVGHSASGATGPPNLIEPDFSAGRPNAGDVASIGTVGDSFENALAESMIILDRTDRSRRAPMPTSEDSPTRARHPARMVDLP